MSGRLEVKTYRCKLCSWESEPKTVFSFETPVFNCDLCGAKCSPVEDKNKDITVEDEPVVVLNSDDEEIDEDWDKNVQNGFDLSDKKNPEEKSSPSQDDSKTSSFQDSFASSVKSFQEVQRERAEQLRRMWFGDDPPKKPKPRKRAPPVKKVERTPYVPRVPPVVVPPRPKEDVLPNPMDLTTICDPPKPLTFPGESMSNDLRPEDLSINCDTTNPPTPKPRANGEPVKSGIDWIRSQAIPAPTVPSLSKGPSPAEFRAAFLSGKPLRTTGGDCRPVRVGGAYDKNVVTDEEEALKRKQEAAKFREEWNRKNGLPGEIPGQNALQVQSELQVQIYQCERCGWESEPKTVFASKTNSYSTCDLCGFRSVKKPQNDEIKQSYNIRMEEHQKMLLQRHTEMSATDLIQSRTAWQEKKNQRSYPKVRNVGGGSSGLDFKKDDTPAGLLKSLYGNANSVHAPGPMATSFYVNDLLRQDDTGVVIDIGEQDENNEEEEEEKEPEEEKTEEPPADNEKRPPKNWESAEVAGFPPGWLWKRTNAWSRRIKLMSPQGKVFNWRNAAVAHMEEQYPYVYTRVQIDRAKNWEDKDWRGKHDKQSPESS